MSDAAFKLNRHSGSVLETVLETVPKPVPGSAFLYGTRF